MLEYLSKKDTKKSLELVSKIVKEGVDVKYFIQEMISELHGLLLIEAGVGKETKMENGEWRMEELVKLIEILAKTYGEVKHAVLPQLPLEIAIVEWGMRSPLGDSSSLATELAKSDLTSNIHSSRSSKSSSLANESLRLASPDTGSPRQNQNDDFPPQAGIFDEKNVLKQLIELVKPYNHSVAGVLRGCTLKSFDGKDLMIETGYKFHKERLDVIL